MGPDNRATDVTLPAICSPRQPCPPPPSPGAGSQGQSRAGGCWPAEAEEMTQGIKGLNQLSASPSEDLCTSRWQIILISGGPKIESD